MSKGNKWDYRDVSVILQGFRDFLLGRKHTLHPRFPLKLSPRSIPPPDIPRGPTSNYSSQYYYERNAFHSVKPPVVAPVAEGPPVKRDPFQKAEPGGVNPESVRFQGLPTPGPSWGWDGHNYYECDPNPPAPPPCPPPSPPPPKYTPVSPPGEKRTCEPPCPVSPDKKKTC